MSDNQGIVGSSTIGSLITVGGTALLAIHAIKAHRLSSFKSMAEPFRDQLKGMIEANEKNTDKLIKFMIEANEKNTDRFIARIDKRLDKVEERLDRVEHN